MLHKTLTMISAEPFCGKTLLMLAQAISLSSGKLLFGKYAPTELRRTLFIGQDAPTWDYARQCIKLVRGYGISAAELAELDTDLILNEGVFLNDKEFISWLRLWHEATQFEVLMLDTLASIHTMNENDNREMSHIMGVLKAIRDEFGCAIIFSHHTGKPSGEQVRSANYRSRGASAIPASVDFHFQLSRTAEDTVAITMPKGRGADDLDPPSAFTIVKSKDAEGNHSVRLELADAVNSEVSEQLFALLVMRPRKRKELVDMVQTMRPNMDADNVSKWVDNQLQAWKRSGAIESKERGIWELCS